VDAGEGAGLPRGEIVPGFPVFCLERWQSLHETRARVLLSESGVEPPSHEELEELGIDLSLAGLDLGYGWTKGWPPLREAIAEMLYGGLIGPENIVVTAGGAEANLLAVLSTIAPGSLVVVDVPNYLQVHGLLEARGARIIRLRRRPEESWHLDLARLAELIEEEGPKAVFVTNPNNPTGAVERRLREVAEAAARKGTILVFDEVYRGLELAGDVAPTVLEAAAEYGAAAVSTGSLSKVYGLPGLRIGWLAASREELADRAWAVKDYTTISSSRIGEKIAREVLAEAEEALRRRAQTIAARNLEALAAALGPCRGVRIYRPEAGAFALIEVPADTGRLARRLYDGYGILVNPGECFEAPGFIRVGLGVAEREEAERSYQELRAALEAEEACSPG
jgi:aspartate/methionine/tyrosine aminotransferase